MASYALGSVPKAEETSSSLNPSFEKKTLKIRFDFAASRNSLDGSLPEPYLIFT